jgi:hypothetical protein
MSDDAAVAPIIIATILKSKTSEIRVALSEYMGAQLLDLRIWEGDEGVDAAKRHATKRGISIKIARIAELIAGLQAAQAEAIKLGRLKVEGSAT